MSWTEERIGMLRQLWSDGLSAAQIGRRLDVSKNAVIGKASRLGLPGRPSPIKRAQGKPAAESKPEKPKQVFKNPNPCCFPIGDPGTDEFHFCGETSMASRPYCFEHYKIAYVTTKAA